MCVDKSRVIVVRTFQSPAGELLLGARPSLVLCDWTAHGRAALSLSRLCRRLGAEAVEGCSPVLDRAAAELGEYFAAARQAFDVPLSPVGTVFQRAVWQALRDIPYGSTLTYGSLARMLRRPRAVRAVAAACGANPLSVFVPCHRVVGTGGKLTGYAGGLDAKRLLLGLESGPDGGLPVAGR